MSCMVTKCLYGNYPVVTIKYITNHKCVYKNYFYHYSVIFPTLSLSLFFLGILDNTK